MVNAGRVESARPADNAVDLVTFGDEQVGQVRAVLAGDTGDKCFSFHFGIQLERYSVVQGNLGRITPGIGPQ